MSSFHNNALVGASGQAGYQIERSLRFNSADSAYLNRTPASAGNRKTWTISWWMKKTSNGSTVTFFDVLNGSAGNPRSTIGFTSSDTFDIQMNPTGASWSVQVTTTQVFRDPSSWYHFVLSLDTTQATAADRIKLYVNGSQITAFSAASYPSQNTDQPVNQNVEHRIGYTYNNIQAINAYLTEVHFIDGQALTPSSFGETDTITGVWKPKKYAGTYGTNGFYLKFADNSGTTSTTLGKDSSGNSNNWTPNNFSVTAGAGNDSMIDTPTPYADGGNGRGNYCTLNAVNRGLDATLSNGNLDISYGSSSSVTGTPGTIGVSAGKWYWEVTPTGGTGSNAVLGIVNTTANSSVSSGIGYFVGYTANGWGYEGVGGTKRNAGSTSYGATFTTNDVIGVAFDADNGTLTFYKNGVSQGQAFSGLTSGPYFPAVSDGSEASTLSMTCNFGQRAFAYTPPSGFLALNTQNLPEPSIKKPNQWMDATTYTGTSASNAIVNAAGFQPDLVWLKNRNYAPGTNHVLVDAVRGVSLGLASNLTNAEFSTVGNFSSINSNGFTVTGTTRDYNFLNDTFVAWQWKESATPGFDIVTYTGDGTSNRTVSHALGVAPAMIIVKDRDSNTNANNWFVWHKSLSSGNNIQLEKTDAAYAVSSTGGGGIGTSPSSSTFTLLNGSSSNVNTNESGDRFVAYLWSEVAGFSKFGSYTGNGSTDGVFVHCGFRPAYVLLKCSSNATSWWCYDSKRDTYNEVSTGLVPNATNADTGGYPLDFLSNGFKFRNANGDFNGSGRTYIFAAFAESPFKYSLAR